MLVTKCFEIYTPETAEEYDIERGYYYRDLEMDAEDIEKELKENDYHWSNSDETGWLMTIYPVEDRKYFEQGKEEYLSLHFQDEDLKTVQEIWRKVNV